VAVTTTSTSTITISQTALSFVTQVVVTSGESVAVEHGAEVMVLSGGIISLSVVEVAGGGGGEYDGADGLEVGRAEVVGAELGGAELGGADG
jgi:hypothetical protein